MNVTTSTYNSLSAMGTFGNFTGFFLIVVVTIFVIGLTMLLMNSYARYKKLRGILRFLGMTAGYFGKGMIGVATFGSLFGGLWYLGQLQERGDINLWIVFAWALVAIAGFFGIAGFGWVLDRVWKNLKKKEKKFKREKS